MAVICSSLVIGSTQFVRTLPDYLQKTGASMSSIAVTAGKIRSPAGLCNMERFLNTQKTATNLKHLPRVISFTNP